MKTFIKHFFLIMTLFYVGTLILANDVRYELPSAIMFAVALTGFVLTATMKGKRKVKI